MSNLYTGSPPHARGKAASRPSGSGWTRITPACAGKRAVVDREGAADGDHPRMRGEKIAANDLAADVEGSPPHARGKD